MNFAKHEQKELWFSHPMIGDCSFDSFTRQDNNPIHTGIGLWEWPVNGFLFIDPVSDNWYVYVSLYAKGYVPLGTVILMKSNNQGGSWDNLGPIFDARGLDAKYHPKDDAMGAVDATVVYDDGIYHMVYGWGSLKEDGGIAYACAMQPEGPFIMSNQPLKSEYETQLIDGIYKRTYACTLIKRANDWLILTMMSTPSNAGGSWAQVALTAVKPEGPYGDPTFLLYPQSKIYHPSPLEFFPAFVHENYVYTPSTSVGKNRTYQVIFRSKIEDAHLEGAWELYIEGSSWHSVLKDSEKLGIWGQTFSGQVVDGKTLVAMYPSVNSEGCGTINIASRPWLQPYKDSFVLSANNAPAMSFIRREFTTFELSATIRSNGAFSLVWGWNGPVGSSVADRWANTSAHELMFTSNYRLSISETGYLIQKFGSNGSDIETIWQISDTILIIDQEAVIIVRQDEESCFIEVNGKQMTVPLPILPGRVGIIAETGSILECSHFNVIGEQTEHWIDLLPTEGLAGAAQRPAKWDVEHSEGYKHGFGYLSSDRPGFVEETASEIKWNFRGTAFRLWMPVLSYGKIRIELNGQAIKVIELIPNDNKDSRLIWEQDGLEDRNYALSVTLIDGDMRCDTCSIRL